MIQALIPIVGNLAGSWLQGKADEKKATSEAKVAKAKAEAEVMKVAATHEAGWEKIMAKSSDNSWKDEAWTIAFILLIAACMWPDAQPYIKQGFIVLKEDCPEFISWGILASIGASFGLKSIGAFKK